MEDASRPESELKRVGFSSHRCYGRSSPPGRNRRRPVQPGHPPHPTRQQGHGSPSKLHPPRQDSPADFQTPSNQAIFRIQSGVCQLFREHLNSENFIEIHSPKLQGAATESGASVFKVQYFNGKLWCDQRVTELTMKEPLSSPRVLNWPSKCVSQETWNESTKSLPFSELKTPTLIDT